MMKLPLLYPRGVMVYRVGKNNESLKAYQAFGEHWGNSGEIAWWHETISISECSILYERGTKLHEQESRVFFYHDGRLEIAEEGKLTHLDYYLGLDTNFQKFNVDDEHCLVVKGEGEKTNGKYRIRIKPLRQSSP